MHLLPNVGNPDTDPRFSILRAKARWRQLHGLRRDHRWTGLDPLFPTMLWSATLPATAKASAAAEGGECCKAAAIFKRVNGGVSLRGEAVKAVD